MFKLYILNLLLAIDDLLNAATGGDPVETISSRIGRLKLRHGGHVPWHHPLAKALDAILESIDPGHAVRAILPRSRFRHPLDKPLTPRRKWWISDPTRKPRIR